MKPIIKVRMHLMTMLLIGAFAIGLVQPAHADVITLTFEGVADKASVNDFYNGGTDSAGNSGVNYGINFSSNSLGLIAFDSGGTGNFFGAQAPSPATVVFF